MLQNLSIAVWKSLSVNSHNRSTPLPKLTHKKAYLFHATDHHTARLIGAFGIVLVAAIVMVVLSKPQLYRQIEYLSYDSILHTIPEAQVSKDVVIVDLDDSSLAEIGQWPWPRYLVAQLLDNLTQADTMSVGVDFIFSEPDRFSLGRLQNSFQEELKVTLNLQQVPEEYWDNDIILARSLAPPRVVSGIWFNFHNNTDTQSPPVPLPEVIFRYSPDAPKRPPISRTGAALFPTPTLASSIQSAGFLNAIPDSDGKLRRMPLLIESQGTIYPSLAFSCFLRAKEDNTIIVTVSAAGIEEVHAGGTRIPTDRQGNMLLPFRPGVSKQFEIISAADILHDRIPKERVEGKMVFFGSSAAGLKDFHATPLVRDYPGIQVHALTADALLSKVFFHAPAWTLGAQVVLILAATLFVALILMRYTLTFCAVLMVVALVIVVSGSNALLVLWGLYLSPAPFVLTLVTSFILLGLIRFRSEEVHALQHITDLGNAQNCAILGLVSIAETRDPDTGLHIMRTQNYVRILAEHLSSHPRFSKELNRENVDAIFRSAPLHDIGKVGIPDSILLKPGKLTDEEYAVMKEHTTKGYRALLSAEENSGLEIKSSFLHYARMIALSHHEKWDGSGYPEGLKGEAIPSTARLMALADVYDALRCRRHYKLPFSHEKTRDIIVAGKESHFDPAVVEAFLELEESFKGIAVTYMDEKEGTEFFETLE